MRLFIPCVSGTNGHDGVFFFFCFYTKRERTQCSTFTDRSNGQINQNLSEFHKVYEVIALIKLNNSQKLSFIIIKSGEFLSLHIFLPFLTVADVWQLWPVRVGVELTVGCCSRRQEWKSDVQFEKEYDDFLTKSKEGNVRKRADDTYATIQSQTRCFIWCIGPDFTVETHTYKLMLEELVESHSLIQAAKFDKLGVRRCLL